MTAASLKKTAVSRGFSAYLLDCLVSYIYFLFRIKVKEHGIKIKKKEYSIKLAISQFTPEYQSEDKVGALTQL